MENNENPNVVNGREYSLWPQFVAKKNDFIGGKLIEEDGDFGMTHETEITDITFGPNGTTGAKFGVVGKDFTCDCDVQYLGIGGRDKRFPEGSLTFSTFFNTRFTIIPKGVIVNDTNK